jgi:hypothetical protein
VDSTVSAFALMPLWTRLVFLYVAVGLAISLYREQRLAGKAVLAAIGGVLLAAVAAPVTAVKALWDARSGTPTACIALVAVLCLCASALAMPNICTNGQCPLSKAYQALEPSTVAPAETDVDANSVTATVTAEVAATPAKPINVQRHRHAKRAEHKANSRRHDPDGRRRGS